MQVLGHPALLAQIFNSLIANALEAMESGGLLRIEVVKRDRRSLTLRLADTGKGMSEQQQRLAFRPFFSTKQGGWVWGWYWSSASWSALAARSA